ncbi:MAG TPA: hypothetical protein VD763_10655, partial [Candidatus Saccharimonadales bacterium]|nr:hypothetical protein [Candidatus Saccharimonadales bacterium]
LGANEPFLASLRTATGGREIVTPLDPWRHDLTATSRFTDLWPWLLVLALVLWPLDIALRRVSIGRRELVAARGWLGGWRGRRGATAARGATGAGLFAARERAGSTEARAALRRSDSAPTVDGTAMAPAAAGAAVAAAPTVASSPAKAVAPSSPAAAPPPAATAAPGPAAPTPPATTTPSEPADTMARLRDAKRRARER